MSTKNINNNNNNDNNNIIIHNSSSDINLLSSASFIQLPVALSLSCYDIRWRHACCVRCCAVTLSIQPRRYRVTLLAPEKPHVAAETNQSSSTARAPSMYLRLQVALHWTSTFLESISCRVIPCSERHTQIEASKHQMHITRKFIRQTRRTVLALWPCCESWCDDQQVCQSSQQTLKTLVHCTCGQQEPLGAMSTPEVAP